MIQVYKIDNYDNYIYVRLRDSLTFAEYRMLLYNNGKTYINYAFCDKPISEFGKDCIFKAYTNYICNKNSVQKSQQYNITINCNINLEQFGTINATIETNNIKQ